MNLRIINNFVGYFSDKMYSFSTQSIKSSTNKKNIKVVVLARHHYIERYIDFPISIRKDVKAAVLFEIESLQSEFYIFYKIAPTNDGVTRVNFWQVPKNIIPKGVLIILPETYVFSFLLKEQELFIYKSLSCNDDVYLTRLKNGLQSSVNKGQSKEIFCHATGINLEHSTTVSPESFVEKLIEALPLALRFVLTDFWVKRKNESRNLKEKLKPYILPSCVFLTIYLASSSSYLYYQLQSAEALAENNKGNIDAVLSVQKSMNELKAQIEDYHSVGESKKTLWKIWPILSPLYEQGVQFQFIRFNGEYVLFRASAKSASAVLEYMLQAQNSEQAEFTTAVRKKGDEENFIIRFKIKSEGA